MLNYKAIEIFTSEEAQHRKKPLADAVMTYIKGLKIAARCIVTRGVAGCYETGEVVTGRITVLSYNMPIRIYIILPAAETKPVLEGLNRIVTDGIVALHDLNVLSHRTRSSLFPRQLLVRDVMTPDPKSVTADTPLSDVARILLSSIFTGLPVVDTKSRPIGVVTQGDLIQKGNMPLRLGLLAEFDSNRLESVLNQLAVQKAADVMAGPPIFVAEDKPLTEAVETMLKKKVKRLPVVDQNKSLTGMLSRLDVFRTVMREAPDWNAFTAQQVEVGHLRRVADIMRRDVHTVLPETPLNEVIQLIDDNDIQRVAVIDTEEKLLGLISDYDLLRYFKPEQEGVWNLFAKVKQAFKQEACRIGELQQCLSETTAETAMTASLITAREEMLIEEAIALMIDKRIKRLPVVDDRSRFKGMISRDSLLRTGFGASD